jgi:two-component system, OmpR family, sensor histidine kinase KdpD
MIARANAMLEAASGRRRHGLAIGASVVVLVVVTVAIGLLKSFVPVLSLGVIYVFAVLPIAVAFGLVYGVLVSVASMLAFNWFFLPPVHTFTLSDSRNWFALAVYLVTATVVSGLAAHARRRATDAEQREVEAALLADIATSLLQGGDVAGQLGPIGERVAALLRARSASIVIGDRAEPSAQAAPIELVAGTRRVGTLELVEGSEPNLAVRRRLLPALASLLAVAVDRERLANEAFDAEALRRSDTVKTAVLRAVSHDLRSPLTAIRAAGDGLQDESLSLSGADRRELVDTIGVEVRRLERVVDNLLALSRLQAGAVAAVPEVWAVDDLVYGALGDVSADTDRVTVSIPADTPPVLVDAVQVRQILSNLIDNALKFSPPESPVTVRGTRTRKEVILRVIDQGRGLPEHELEHVFEPFYRGAPAQDQTGTGLGLAIARGFAEANGGRLWAESRPGQGAGFALALPPAEDAPA